MAHDAGVARNDAQIRRGSADISKDRTKALIAAAIRGSSCALPRLAKAGKCSRRTLERAAEEVSLPSFDVLLNMLDEDPTILDAAFRAKGWQLAPISASVGADFETLAAMCEASGEFGAALADGKRVHTETLRVADKISRALPGMLAIVREAAELRGVA